MAGSRQKIPSELPVSGIYKYFKALERTKHLDAFLAACDDKKHVLGVSNTLFILGHKHFKASKSAAARKGASETSMRASEKAAKPPARTTRAVGTDCPACPRPPRL